jgi:hypothetical protein
MVPVAPIIPRIALVFTFHMRCIIIITIITCLFSKGQLLIECIGVNANCFHPQYLSLPSLATVLGSCVCDGCPTVAVTTAVQTSPDRHTLSSRCTHTVNL